MRILQISVEFLSKPSHQKRKRIQISMPGPNLVAVLNLVIFIQQSGMADFGQIFQHQSVVVLDGGFVSQWLTTELDCGINTKLSRERPWKLFSIRTFRPRSGQLSQSTKAPKQ
jgi:hypothetical protein